MHPMTNIFRSVSVDGTQVKAPTWGLRLTTLLLLASAVISPAALPPSSGGPDNFGYRYSDSRPTLNGLPTGVDSQFGWDVALDGSLMVAGAPFEPSQNLDKSGNVYVYDLASATPSLPIASLNNPTPAADDEFGYHVAISGTRVVVSGRTLGSGVYVYDLANANPTIPVAQLSGYASDVAIAGNWVAIGVANTDVRLYDLTQEFPTNPVYTITQPFTNTINNQFGVSVAMSGSRLIVGDSFYSGVTNEAGAAFVYDLSGLTPTTPIRSLYLPPGGQSLFGTDVAIDGTRVVVGEQNGYAYVYDLNDSNTVLTLESPSLGTDQFGSHLSISGSRVIVGAENDDTGAASAGSAYLYELNSASPTNPIATLRNPSPVLQGHFGGGVAIAGTRVVVGAFANSLGAAQAGIVYEYAYPSTTPTRLITPPGSYPATPALNFTELDGAPGALEVSGLTTDDSTQAVDIGFPFFFYEQEHTVVYPSSNGLLAFGQGNPSFSPTVIPNGGSGGVRNFIAPFWADLIAGASGKVFYKTIGDAPSRIFIIEYKNFEQLSHSANKITVQAKLFEGSNAIEFQYRSISNFTAVVGKKRTIGIEDASGLRGLQYRYGDVGNESSDLPSSPFAVRFERPVFTEVESTFEAPDGSLRSVAIGGKLRPHAGRFAVPYGSVQRFEAPEFVYLNKDLVELDAIGALNHPDPEKIAYYRVKNLGYAIDGEDVQGVDLFFERTITGDIKVIWRWELEHAVIVDSATGDSGLGNPDPGVGRFWMKKDTQFSAAIDTIVEDSVGGVRVRNTGYASTTYPVDGTPITVITDLTAAGSRMVTDVVLIDGPLRIKWLSLGEVRYRFDATTSSGVGLQQLNGEPFVRVYATNGLSSVTYFGPTTNGVGAGPNIDVWIPLERRVDVGCFYRTFDRCLTLAGPTPEQADSFIANPSGDLPSTLTLSRLVDVDLMDSEGRTRLARVHSVSEVSSPSEIHWLMQPTVFRAEIPLGEGLNAVTPDNWLVPALCGSDPVLRTGVIGPGGPFSGPKPDLDDAGVTDGDAQVWDQTGKVLYPVQPGSYTMAWPDANLAATTYAIEIVSGFPGDTQRLSSVRQDVWGHRLTTIIPISPEATPAAMDGFGQALTNGVGAPLYYLKHVVIGPVADAFPGAPTAHYRHLFDQEASRRPPTRLDDDATDRWQFRSMPFSESAVGALIDASNGQDYQAQGAGRSVLLYSYRPDPTETATGDLTKERLAVRIVRSEAIALVEPTTTALGRNVLRPGASGLGLVRSGATPTSIVPGKNFTVDFWVDFGSISSNQVLLDLGNIPLTVQVDPVARTLRATYFNMDVTRALPDSDADWHHVIVHVFESLLGGIAPRTSLALALDGVSKENAVLNTVAGVSSNAPTLLIDSTVQSNSLRLGVGNAAGSGLRMDGVRLYSYPAQTTASQARLSFAAREFLYSGAGTPPAVLPLLKFGFEAGPVGTLYANEGSVAGVGLGVLASDVRERDNLQEVATRIRSVLDRAGFGSGYVLNELSNYNAALYQRDAAVGGWGPLYPVNRSFLFTGSSELQIAYYENPYLNYPTSSEHLHPNVAWPYVAAAYTNVVYPMEGPHKDNRLYIASRIGSEGVDLTGRPQTVFDLAHYANLTIYNQSDRGLAGFNPNEEHALAAVSYRPSLKVKNMGESLANNPPLAAYALQSANNRLSLDPNLYTSDPWVLVEVDNLERGETEMAAYLVRDQRNGAVPFPRPLDSELADGLTYEAAPNPDDRFLTIDPAKSHDFAYRFDYPIFAGDLVIPPYPLSLVVGNVTMADDRGGNIQVDGLNQRTFWKDVNSNAWVVAGDGTFFNQYFYPYRSDFYLPGVTPGTPVAWLPQNTSSVFVAAAATQTDPPSPLADLLAPVQVVYHSFWRSDYPKLKRGETLTYQGGEYYNEHPGVPGLPALVAMGAAEVVYDSATPEMIITDGALTNYSARVIRPLDRHEAPLTTAEITAAGFSPASPTLFVIGERWYFSDLPGSLQRRLYYNSLTETLVFRGYLNDKESGDSDLTAGPDALNILEPNVMTKDERTRVKALSSDTAWTDAIDELYLQSQNPNWVRALNAGVVGRIEGLYLAGVTESAAQTDLLGLTQEVIDANKENYDSFQEAQEAYLAKLAHQRALNATFFPGPLSTLPIVFANIDPLFGTLFDALLSDPNAPPPLTLDPLPAPAAEPYAHMASFGVGAALVPNPALLTRDAAESAYVTIAENNRSELDGAPISLHIIQIVPERYRGAIKVIEAANAFSEKITLQHNGEFGANTDDLYYEWWIRDAASLDVVEDEVLTNGTLAEVGEQGQTLWQEYIPADREPLTDDLAKHAGLHSIVFEGRPDVVLADKLVLMRYRHKSETAWTLVPIESTQPASVAWQPGSPAPFQWAGAANSPQLQANGSLRYVPQLVMGWVKRILDRINPYEARYSDFFSTESPATYSSQIQIAGPPFVAKVALNPDKDVIENTGLIELYETVLARAKELSIDNSNPPPPSEGIDRALLLAATRLSVLYEILAREAYSDAQDSTIRLSDEFGPGGAATFTHAFENQEADLLHEELALLRGTDFLKSYPVYNRMIWNYVKGLGEAAYNVNYNIYDENTDGFINEDDARALYPQGHGDAWGHFGSALDKTYTLLRHPGFSWKARAELYSLMQNVIEADYLDEKTFARLAAAKARAGRDIVRNTYRQFYTQDPDGQWQGYTDGADPARAWGVSEWAHRAGQGAYFDWAVANAMLPDLSTTSTVENLDRIDRLGAKDEIGEIAGALHEIEVAMDEANGGVNPLGFDADAMAFDIDPLVYDGGDQGRLTHFEQIYARAVTAGNNARATLDYAVFADNKLRRIGTDTDTLIVDALRQDIDYRNRLIEIFGRPYEGTMGFGKIYPEGYEGPDTKLFAYLDHTTIQQIIPGDEANAPASLVTYVSLQKQATSVADDHDLQSLYADVLGNALQNVGTTLGSYIGQTFGVGSEDLTAAFLPLLGSANYQDFTESVTTNQIPVRKRSPYAFQSGDDWGIRTSYGKIQRVLEQDLRERVALDSAIQEYVGFLEDYEIAATRLDIQAQLIGRRNDIFLETLVIKNLQAQVNKAQLALRASAEAAADTSKTGGDAGSKAPPTNVGISSDVAAPARSGIQFLAMAAQAASWVARKSATLALAAADFTASKVLTDLDREVDRTKDLVEFEGMLVDLVSVSGREAPLRNAIGMHEQNLEVLRQEYVTAQAEGFRLLREREAYNKILAASVQKNRYSDMVLRLSRNEAMTKYQSAFNNAARYAWLATRAYDYETSLDPGDPAAAGGLLDAIVKERQLGMWTAGQPQIGEGGLAETLAQLDGNFQVLKGQLGLNNPQAATEKISLRHELFRIAPATTNSFESDRRWKEALMARTVDNLFDIPEFLRYCRPFAAPADGAQPGIVIRFRTTIEPGLNLFGNKLGAGDHAYSSANFATKIRGFGVWMDGYNDASLATTPRAYIVPVGDDYMRVSTALYPVTRVWNIQEQRIPLPFTINNADVTSPDYIPSLDGVDGVFSALRRHGDFRIYHNAGASVDESELVYDSRLISRSVWNSEWLLIIPGANLAADPEAGLTTLAESISDIRLFFKTYSHQGQ